MDASGDYWRNLLISRSMTGKEEDFRAVKIEAELILEANRLQLMKQDLEKAENAYLSSCTSKKKSKTFPGATAAALGDPSGKKDNQKKNGNPQMAWIVRHNNESVREAYVKKTRKEVKLFASALKAVQSNNRIVMAQRKHLDDFLQGRIIGRLECGRTQLEVPQELEIAQTVISRLWFSLQSDSCRTLIWRAPGTRYHQENTIERHRYGGAGWLTWGGIILGSRTYLHVQSVKMTGHIYRDVLLKQHASLFRGAMSAEFLFMDDNSRPHRANIVGECLHSEDITRMDWPASILTGLESRRACVVYAWPTNCSPSTPSHLSTGTSEGIA
ncbi:transposable element Tcb1 transposase [Trichonephila clavipes]|nr:transposable element Tcb1 transposase [Trichonephila clavipes]